MDRLMSREQRRARDADLLARSKAFRLLWPSSQEGTALRVVNANVVSYRAKPTVKKRKVQLTEAQDNAIGRALRRRTNRKAKGWRPYGKR